MRSFSLLELMLVVMLLGVFFAASAYMDDSLIFAFFLVELFTLTGLFATSVLGLIYRRGPARGFWIGFALFGIPLFLWYMCFGLYLGASNQMPFLIALLLAMPLFAWLGGSIGRRFATPGPDAPAAPIQNSHPLDNPD